MYAQGTGEFLKHWYNAVDFVVVMLSFVATVAYVSVEISGYYKLLVIGRIVRIVSLLRIYTEKKNLTKGARLMVSENKRRYRQDGFDLDLVYVTDRIIAMSYPSSGKMSWYRNPIQEVERFSTRNIQTTIASTICAVNEPTTTATSMVALNDI
uniref:Uncharacterized protein n=1 Tax=Rhipicephalus microplus TaxID=6941 RepID=A0A6G5A9N9_RHIMP